MLQFLMILLECCISRGLLNFFLSGRHALLINVTAAKTANFLGRTYPNLIPRQVLGVVLRPGFVSVVDGSLVMLLFPALRQAQIISA